MKWDVSEIAQLSPILETIRARLEPLKGKHLLILCSAGGEAVFWLAERMDGGHVTDVILTHPVTADARAGLRAIGLDYLCEATPEDFCGWMQSAGMDRVEVLDFTPTLKRVWESRRERDPNPAHRLGYHILLNDPGIRLGKGLFYIGVSGRKPPA